MSSQKLTARDVAMADRENLRQIRSREADHKTKPPVFGKGPLGSPTNPTPLMVLEHSNFQFRHNRDMLANLKLQVDDNKERILKLHRIILDYQMKIYALEKQAAQRDVLISQLVSEAKRSYWKVG